MRITASRMRRIIKEEAGRVLREMSGPDDEPDYDAMDVGPVPSSALVKRVVPNEFDLEFAEEFGGGEGEDEDEGTDPRENPLFRLHGARDALVARLERERGGRHYRPGDPLDAILTRLDKLIADYEAMPGARRY